MKIMQINNLSYMEELRDSSKEAILGGDSNITFDSEVNFSKPNNSIIAFGFFRSSSIKVKQDFTRVQAGGEGETTGGIPPGVIPPGVMIPGLPSSPSM